MVGKRAWDTTNGSRTTSYTNGNGNSNDHSPPSSRQPGDGNPRSKPRASRFQDAAESALEDQRREELKQLLIEGVDFDSFEKFRKPVEEIKALKDKKLRRFYEEQNEMLND